LLSLYLSSLSRSLSFAVSFAVSFDGYAFFFPLRPLSVSFFILTPSLAVTKTLFHSPPTLTTIPGPLNRKRRD
jgi:hypothetical protein